MKDTGSPKQRARKKPTKSSSNIDFELVFTDVQTGGPIDGLELAREVSRRWPHICVVVASGATCPRPGDLPDEAVFLRKPISAALEHKVILERCRPKAGGNPHEGMKAAKSTTAAKPRFRFQRALLLLGSDDQTVWIAIMEGDALPTRTYNDTIKEASVG